MKNYTVDVTYSLWTEGNKFIEKEGLYKVYLLADSPKSAVKQAREIIGAHPKGVRFIDQKRGTDRTV